MNCGEDMPLTATAPAVLLLAVVPLFVAFVVAVNAEPRGGFFNITALLLLLLLLLLFIALAAVRLAPILEERNRFAAIALSI
jgi:peptidoglycan biosynthesis protein MviN/MurJ (putative lipid II flippase)